MPHIQTVLGPVDPAESGRVMPHEHLLSLVPGPWLAGGYPSGCGDLDSNGPDSELVFDPTDRRRAQDQVDQAVAALGGLRELGVGTVVDLSPYGVVGRDLLGRNISLLQEISVQTGLHIVSGTAVYLESYSPAWAVTADLTEMTRRFVHDAVHGIGGTDARAGVLGEQATGLGEITPHEEKCLRAAGRAQAETGLAVFTHTTHGTMAHEQIHLLTSEQADPTRVVIGHMDTHPDLDYVRSVVRAGVNIAFDTIGKQYWDFRIEPLPEHQADGEFAKRAYLRSDQTRADRIATLVDEGFADQILLAQDLTGSEVYLNPATHGRWGYSYLAGSFAELLRRRGVTDTQLDTMWHHNPQRLLTIT